MHGDDAFRRWGRVAVAAALGGVIGWYAFIAHREVPVLDLFDLAVHETGHLLFGFAPRMLMFLAGSAMQVLVPLGLAWYFGWFRRDAAGGGFCLAWAGTSMWDVSVYVADAPVQALPLIGGGQHDWAYLLGEWNVIHLAGSIAGFIEFCGAVLTVAGIVVAAGAAIAGLTRRSQASVVPIVPVAPSSEPDPWLAAAELPFRFDRASGE
jgi:hypothetical protein